MNKDFEMNPPMTNLCQQHDSLTWNDYNVDHWLPEYITKWSLGGKEKFVKWLSSIDGDIMIRWGNVLDGFFVWWDFSTPTTVKVLMIQYKKK